MAEMYFILKKKGSSKEAKISTEEVEELIKKSFKEHIVNLKWYFKPIARLMLNYFGETLAFGLEKLVDLYNEKKK